MPSVKVALPSLTWSASGTGTIDLRLLPKQVQGRIAHLKKISFDITYDPTFTATPTVSGDNSFFTRLDLYDGTMSRFVGGANHVRAHERISSGGVRVADSDQNTSTNDRWFTRTMHMGPPNFLGYKEGSDFAIPTALLDNAAIQYTFCALTGFSSDTTANTGSATVVAELELLDEIRIPPAYQFQNYAITGTEQTITGRALYTSVSLINSSAFDAISGNDFGTLRLDCGQGDVVTAITAEQLTAMYLDDYAAGEIGGIAGELHNAAADGNKQVDRASPLAIVATTADLQPVLWSGPNAKLSKCHWSEGATRVSWSGAQTTGTVALVGRVLAQPPNVVKAKAIEAVSKLNYRPKGPPTIKTHSKKEYKGPLGDFFPWKVPV